MPESNTGAKPPKAQARTRARRAVPRRDQTNGHALATPIHALVAEHPWAMVSAATGAGLAVGIHSRKLVKSELGSMLTATASGVALRFMTNALAQLLEAPDR